MSGRGIGQPARSSNNNKMLLDDRRVAASSTITASSTTTGPVKATDVPATTHSIYPEAFREVVAGRSKRRLGDVFGLKNFGVNQTTLAPGASSALKHRHKHQDEFVYVLSGTATCTIGDTRYVMKAGDCIGFPKNDGLAHCITNEQSSEEVVYLEIGDRSPEDVVEYPDVDLKAVEEDGKWKFLHKDGSPYD